MFVPAFIFVLIYLVTFGSAQSVTEGPQDPLVCLFRSADHCCKDIPEKCTLLCAGLSCVPQTYVPITPRDPTTTPIVLRKQAAYIWTQVPFDKAVIESSTSTPRTIATPTVTRFSFTTRQSTTSQSPGTTTNAVVPEDPFRSEDLSVTKPMPNFTSSNSKAQNTNAKAQDEDKENAPSNSKCTRSQPLEPCIPRQQANQHFQTCCSQRSLAACGRTFCHYDWDVRTVGRAQNWFEPSRCNSTQLTSLLRCASGARNNTNCCKKAVGLKTRACLLLCDPMSIDGGSALKVSGCAQVMRQIMQCHHANLHID